MLKPKFTKNDIAAHIREQHRAFNKALESRLIRTGEEFVKEARETNTYRDQTGNLRSSIGYILTYDGNIIAGNFTNTASGEGASEAEKLANQLAAEHPVGYSLIVVAGMDYAAAVESRGLDVISGTSQVIEERLKKQIARIMNKR